MVTANRRGLKEMMVEEGANQERRPGSVLPKEKWGAGVPVRKTGPHPDLRGLEVPLPKTSLHPSGAFGCHCNVIVKQKAGVGKIFCWQKLVSL